MNNVVAIPDRDLRLGLVPASVLAPQIRKEIAIETATNDLGAPSSGPSGQLEPIPNINKHQSSLEASK